jgi:hypothetical protein
MQHRAELIFLIEYFREYEFIFEMALGHVSGGPGEMIDEKNIGPKISCYCHFNRITPLKAPVLLVKGIKKCAI